MQKTSEGIGMRKHPFDKGMKATTEH